MAVLRNLGQRHAAAKARYVIVGRYAGTRLRFTAPGRHGIGNAGNGGIVQFTLHAGNHVAQLARVDEQHLALALFLLAQKPQAGRNLRVEKQLPRQRHHHLHHIGIYYGSADHALVVLAGTHAAVGQHDASTPGGLQVVQHVLQPGIVGIALGRGAIGPARVFLQAAVPPVAHVEGRIGQNVVGAQVRVLISHKGIGWLASQVEVDAANGQVHGRQPPGCGVGLLPVDGHITPRAAVCLNELLALHKHATRAAAGVIHLPVVRCQHGHQHLDNRRRGVELPAALAFGAGKHAQKILVHLPQHITRYRGIFAKANGGHQIHQLAQLAIGQLGAGVALVQNALEARVLDLDQGQGVVNQLADFGAAGAGAQGFPARCFGHPEHVGAGVVVAVFQLGGNVLFGGIAVVVLVLRVTQARLDFGLAGGEGVGDVFEEDQAKHQMLVFGSVHVGAQLVGGGPEGFLGGIEHGGNGL